MCYLFYCFSGRKQSNFVTLKSYNMRIIPFLEASVIMMMAFLAPVASGAEFPFPGDGPERQPYGGDGCAGRYAYGPAL